MVSAINLISLIIIINPIRPALVVPKFVKIVQNLPQADSAILSITSWLNKFVNNIPYFSSYFQIAFVRGLIIVGAMDSTGFGSNLYQDSPKRYIGKRKELQFVWIPDFVKGVTHLPA